VLALGALNVLLLLWLLRRRPADARAEVLASLQAGNERLERELRQEISESARTGRLELSQNLATFQQTLVQQAAEATRTQNTQIDAFGQQLALLQKSLSDTLTLQLSSLSVSNARRMAEVRTTLPRSLDPSDYL
jgi:DNA recombination protein RmuC